MLKNNIDKPFLDRAIQGQYPPSSIFKLVTASAALKSGVSINKEINCPGFMWIGNRIFKCWNVHHVQNFIGGIANSCDVYFYTTGIAVGREEIMYFAQNYGINKKTEIDLPGENTGLLPDMDWFKKKYNRPWQNGDTANISIGQGDLLITPVEVNALTMAIANDGVMMKPHLLQKIVSISDNKDITNIPDEVLRTINLSQEQIDVLKRGMYGVTTYGTASWMKDASPIPIAGKSGTGEAGKEQQSPCLVHCFRPLRIHEQERYDSRDRRHRAWRRRFRRGRSYSTRTDKLLLQEQGRIPGREAGAMTGTADYAETDKIN